LIIWKWLTFLGHPVEESLFWTTMYAFHTSRRVNRGGINIERSPTNDLLPVWSF